MISVSIGAPDPAMSGPFDALAQRAAGNVFMHPAALCAAWATGFALIHVLCAFDDTTLVGFWALRAHRIWPAFLAAPPYGYAFVSNPVIDPDHVDTVMPAFLEAIANHPTLPKVIRLKLLDADAPTYLPLLAALESRRGRVLTLAARARPFLAHAAERKRSGSTGKKLRQDWNRLAALGAVEIANDRDADAVGAAFEVFLQMELRSWKGAKGTALLCRPDDASFTRRLITDLGARGAASVALLRVDGRPIAAQVLLYGGTTAYTWKTAFDAEFAKFSPGALLLDKVTDALFVSGCGSIESCSADGGFMDQLWAGRRMTIDLLIDVAREKSVNFALVAAAERVYAWLRGRRDQWRAMRPVPKRKIAVTPG